MEGIRFPVRKGRKSLQFILFGLIAVLAGGVSPNLFAAPQKIGEQGQSTQASGQMGHETGIPTPLSVLIEEAKRNDPAIRAAEQAAKSATFVAPQMSALPDPQFTLQQFSVGSPRPFAGYTNSDFAYIGVGASQQLPYPGKLKLRGAVADRDADTAKAHIGVVLQDEIESLKTTYFHLAYLQQTLGTLQRNAALLEQVEQQTEAHYSSGQGNQQDVLKAQLERTKILREISMHHQLVGEGQAELKRILRRPQDSSDIIAEPVAATFLTYTASELLDKVREQNPNIHENSAMVQRNRTAVELAQKEFRPDFGVSYMYENTDRKFRDYYELSFNVNFPRRKPRQAALAQAQVNVERAQTDLDTQLQIALAEVQKQYVMVKASEEQLLIYRDGLIPQAQATIQAGLAAYQSNREDFETLFSSFMDVLSLNLEYQQTILDHETALAHISTAPQGETPLAPIQLSPQRMQSIGVKVGTVESRVIRDEIRSYGNIQPNERRFAYVQTRFAGWIRQIYADATGDFIEKGQPLFTIYSPDLVASEREYLLAKKSAAALQQSAVSGVADGATSLIIASKSRLQQFDISERDIAKLDDTGEPITDLTVMSPVSGYITEKNALPNLYVQPDTKLYTIADLSEIWVLAQIFQNDAGRIKPGDPAEVTVDAYPGQIFKGKVDYLLPQLDMATRTLSVRLVLPNPGLKLRPGMYVNVSLKLPLGQRLIVPDSAVFHSGTKNLIFTYAGDGNIAPREVELGPHVGDQLVISKGVKAGEQIVTSANFLIDSEAQLAAAAGAFMPPPPGAGQAAAMNAPAPTQAAVELATVPSPPQKGSNTIRIKLTDQAGKPITGAQVNVTFFMAAMPAMGMAAMKTVVQASDKGGGMYEGNGALGSGGTWQVTITAQQNGQTIANKQLSVNATGGM